MEPLLQGTTFELPAALSISPFHSPILSLFLTGRTHGDLNNGIERFTGPGKDDPDLDRRLRAYRASNAAFELKIAIAGKAGDTAAVDALHDELIANVRAHADLLQEHHRYLQAQGLAPADEPASKPSKRTARKRTAKP